MAVVTDIAAARSRLRGRAAWLALVVIVAVGGCSAPNVDPVAERGRQVYLAQCIACHNPDPAKDGPLGPPVKGVSRELLEAKVLKGTYPPGYVPKRRTTIMPPQPALAGDIPNLTAFLR